MFLRGSWSQPSSRVMPGEGLPASLVAASLGGLPFPSSPHALHHFGLNIEMPHAVPRPLPGRGVTVGTLRPGPTWVFSELAI